MKSIDEIMDILEYREKKYNRIFGLFVNPELYGDFLNHSFFNGKRRVFLDKEEHIYIRLGKISLTADGWEHVDTAVLINPEGCCEKSRKELLMMPAWGRDLECSFETIEVHLK